MLIFSPSFRDGSCCSLNAPTLEVFFPFPYIKDKIKNQEKNDICEFVIKKIEKMFPSLGKHIVTKDIATPEAFYKQTLNTNGAILGKKISTKMNSNISFPQNLFASGLFFTGAWYGYGGTSEVAISGKRTAGAMLQVMKKKSIGGLIKL
jgi:phytoene dehydrogenase-like protein